MRDHALLTVVGADRIGIVEELSSELLERECNIEESRMALLGGDFAAILLLSGAPSGVGRLVSEAESIGKKLNLTISVRMTETARASGDALPYILESSSLDTHGIVRAVSGVLRRYGINIDDMETETVPAPWTGAPMFNMRARLSVPRSVSVSKLRGELSALENEHNLDLRLQPASRSMGDAG